MFKIVSGNQFSVSKQSKELIHPCICTEMNRLSIEADILHLFAFYYICLLCICTEMNGLSVETDFLHLLVFYICFPIVI